MTQPNDSDFLKQRINGKDEDEYRTAFQRDRDRIIHSRAFRRMMHKTQVFNANYGDHYRNRLTHTLEVSQIARSIGKILDLDDELIEAIALGHDLGHTPFGHIGERTLNNILHGSPDEKIKIPQGNQGFKHNFQSLRVVDSLETRIDDYKGLNLTLATREGILKHTKMTMNGKPVNYGTSLNLDNMDLAKPSFTLEGQVVAIADSIAQYTHDLEDGLRGNIIKVEDLKQIDLISENIDLGFKSSADEERAYILRNGILKRLVGFFVKDVICASKNNIGEYINKYGKPSFVDQNNGYNEKCITFTEKTEVEREKLDKKAYDWVLFSQFISQADAKSEYIIKRLFRAYFMHPHQLPDYILERYCSQSKIKFEGRKGLKAMDLKKSMIFVRAICDHIAGMTDQFASREYNKLYLPEYY